MSSLAMFWCTFAKRSGVRLGFELPFGADADPHHPEHHPGDHRHGDERHGAVDDLLGLEGEFGATEREHGAEDQGTDYGDGHATPDFLTDIFPSSFADVRQENAHDQGRLEAFAQADEEGSEEHAVDLSEEGGAPAGKLPSPSLMNLGKPCY